MRMLRPLAGGVVTTATVVCGADVAEAELILSAICAMNVPSPIMMAAKIIMLRITPLGARKLDFTTRRACPRAKPGTERCHFDEKDERTVNAVISQRLQKPHPEGPRSGRLEGRAGGERRACMVRDARSALLTMRIYSRFTCRAASPAGSAARLPDPPARDGAGSGRADRNALRCSCRAKS